MTQAKIGYQLYSAREEAARDLPLILRTLKAQGYEGVEFAGFYGHSAQEVKAMLEETGLKAASSHVPLHAMKDDPFGVLSFHQKIDCKFIAIPYLQECDRPGQPGFADTIRFICSFAKLCNMAGITLMYHNHDFEFEAFSGMYGLDFLYRALPADLLQTEIDTCWVKYAGLDPKAYLRQYTGRAPVVHIKDFVGFKGELSPYQLIGQKDNPDARIAQFSYRPYGYGIQDAGAWWKPPSLPVPSG